MLWWIALAAYVLALGTLWLWFMGATKEGPKQDR